MTTTIKIELQPDLLSFIELYSKQINRRRDEIIADAIRLLHNEWELEQGYLEDNEDTIALIRGLKYLPKKHKFKLPDFSLWPLVLGGLKNLRSHDSFPRTRL
jgi:hypothetical protein